MKLAVNISPDPCPLPRPRLVNSTFSGTHGVLAVNLWMIPVRAAAASVSRRLFVSFSPFSSLFFLLATGGSLITGSAHKRFVSGRFVSASHPLTRSHGEIRVTHTHANARTPPDTSSFFPRVAELDWHSGKHFWFFDAGFK